LLNVEARSGGSSVFRELSELFWGELLAEDCHRVLEFIERDDASSVRVEDLQLVTDFEALQWLELTAASDLFRMLKNAPKKIEKTGSTLTKAS